MEIRIMVTLHILNFEFLELPTQYKSMGATEKIFRQPDFPYAQVRRLQLVKSIEELFMSLQCMGEGKQKNDSSPSRRPEKQKPEAMISPGLEPETFSVLD